MFKRDNIFVQCFLNLFLLCFCCIFFCQLLFFYTSKNILIKKNFLAHELPNKLSFALKKCILFSSLFCQNLFDAFMELCRKYLLKFVMVILDNMCFSSVLFFLFLYFLKVFEMLCVLFC